MCNKSGVIYASTRAHINVQEEGRKRGRGKRDREGGEIERDKKRDSVRDKEWE